MSKKVIEVREQLRTMLIEALGRCIADGTFPANPIPNFQIEAPADKSHGDFASNIAMVSAKAFRAAPRKIAEEICKNLDISGSLISRFEIAGPGFINFFVDNRLFAEIIKDVNEKKEAYGRSDFGNGERILVEFVSANPTGPMHMGNARGGAIGDCLSAVLDAAGYYVEREFYVNDAGNQIDKFALSLDVRYRQLFVGEENAPLPEDCYQGGDIIDLAKPPQMVIAYSLFLMKNAKKSLLNTLFQKTSKRCRMILQNTESYTILGSLKAFCTMTVSLKRQ